jgi:membrane protease YdiL (CAAX protease family)
MTEIANPQQSRFSPISLWGRVPLAVRAVISGFVVFQVIQMGWLVLFLLNIQHLPTVPWNVPLGLLFLWVTFSYFNGRWAPRSTSKPRQISMRARRLTRREWQWSLLAIPLLALLLFSFIIVFYRLTGIHIPEDDFDLSALPWWTLLPSLVMLSINAGVSEEAGFRGYMQGDLEAHYGPKIAIISTAVIFWLLHLNHVSGPARFALLIVMGLLLGSLAHAANSILPAIVAHAFVDSFAFITGAGGIGLEGIHDITPIAETGVDVRFMIALILLLLSAPAYFWTVRKLSVVRGGPGS